MPDRSPRLAGTMERHLRPRSGKRSSRRCRPGADPFQAAAGRRGPLAAGGAVVLEGRRLDSCPEYLASMDGRAQPAAARWQAGDDPLRLLLERCLESRAPKKSWRFSMASGARASNSITTSSTLGGIHTKAVGPRPARGRSTRRDSPAACARWRIGFTRAGPSSSSGSSRNG